MTSEYRTTELSMAAFLLTEGHVWQRIERIDDRMGAWVFRDGDELSELINTFQLGHAEVEPKEFAQSLARARSALFQHLDASRQA